MDIHLTTTQTMAFIGLLVWEMIWKGFALWIAARNGRKDWFVVLLVLNTAGILPLLYIWMNMKPAKRVAKKR